MSAICFLLHSQRFIEYIRVFLDVILFSLVKDMVPLLFDYGLFFIFYFCRDVALLFKFLSIMFVIFGYLP